MIFIFYLFRKIITKKNKDINSEIYLNANMKKLKFSNVKLAAKFINNKS